MTLNILPKVFPLDADNKAYVGCSLPVTPQPPADTTSLRPPAGYFKDISLNTIQGAYAAVGINISDINGPVCNWSSGVATPEGVSLFGGGHLNPGGTLSAGTSNFSLTTRTWTIRNRPSRPLLEGEPFNKYGESTSTDTLGHLYPPHTYDGLVLQTPKEGGGPNGTLWHNFWPGTPNYNTVHKLDLSEEFGVPTRVIDHIPMSGGSSNYPMSAKDSARGGYWLTTYDGQGGMSFVKWDGTFIKQNAGYLIYGDNSLTYIPAPYDCLVGMGRADADNKLFKIFVSPIVNGIAQAFTEVTFTGSKPNDGRCGGVWVDSLGCIVSYEGDGSNRVHRLTPPNPDKITTAPWVFSAETVQGVAGQAPSQPGINTNNNQPYPMNGTWSRFVYHEGLNAFLLCGSSTAPVQVWTLQGM